MARKKYEEVIKNALPENMYDLFNQYRFIVPEYQRYYSWEDAQIKQLIDDILYCIDNNENLFLGIMLFKSLGYNKLEIIDGQQRIITFLIILRAIIETAKLDEYTKKQYGKLLSKPSLDKKDQRARLNKKNPNFFFKKYILYGDSNAECDKRIYFIKKIIRSKEIFDSTLKNFPKKFINKISNFLQRHIEIVAVITHDELQAFDIFESINSKKADLTIADLTKNILFKKCKKVNEEKYKRADEKWNQLIDLFEESPERVSNFLKTYWASKYRIARGKKFYKEYKKSTLFTKTKDPLKLIEDMLKYAEIYNELSKPSEEYWKDEAGKKIVPILNDLIYLRIKTAYPLLLQIKNTFSHNKRINKIFAKIENLSFIKIVLFQERPGKLEVFYSKKSSELFQEKNKKKMLGKIDKEITQQLKNYLKEGVFENNIKNISLNNKVAKYILFKIFKNKSGTKVAKKQDILQLKDDSVEHIMPENLNKWKKQIINIIKNNEEDFESYKYYNEEEKIIKYHEEFCYCLGNLALLTKTDNSKTRDDIFKDKKKIYKSEEKNNYLLKDVVYQKEWTYKEIEKRTEKLAVDMRKIISNS